MDTWKKPNVYLIGVILLTIIGCFLFSNRILSPFEDICRELYFPIRMLDGELLYRDIFNLFGPFSYLLNALIFKFFGTGFNTVVGIGYLSALLVTCGMYKLSESFLPRKEAFLLTAYVIVFGVYNFINFRYTLPYTYAILYGFIAFIWSLFFFVKSEKTSESKYMYLSALLTGIAVSSKYEYFLYAVLFLGFICYLCRDKLSRVVLPLFLVLLPSLLCFGFLMVKGLTFSDLLSSFNMVKAISLTEGYRVFYTRIGTFCSQTNINYFFNSALSFFIIYLMFFYMDYVGKKKPFAAVNLLLYFLIVYYSLRYLYYYTSGYVFSFLPMAVLLLVIINLRTTDRVRMFVCLSSLFSAVKVFWACNILYYGVFFAPVLMLSAYILIEKYAVIKKTLSVFLIIVSCFALYGNFNDREKISIPLNGFDKPVYSSMEMGWNVNAITGYINKNTKPTDKVIVYPDGLIINYLTGRTSDDVYYSLEPPYLSAYGEDNLIKHFRETKPEYFILANKNMSIYGKEGICKDYAINFCKFVKSDYIKVKEFQYDSDSRKYEIYKRKDLIH